MTRKHDLTTVGPGIPACTCGTVFEWKYEHESHKRFWENREQTDPDEREPLIGYLLVDQEGDDADA